MYNKKNNNGGYDMLDIVKKVHATMVRQAKPINIVNTLFIEKDYNVFLKDVQKDLNKQNIKLSINNIKKFDMFFRKKFIKKTYQLNKNTIKELSGVFPFFIGFSGSSNSTTDALVRAAPC